MRSYPSQRSVARFAAEVVGPALVVVEKEFQEQGYASSLATTVDDESGIEEQNLFVEIPDRRSFRYRVGVVEAPVPMFGGRMSRETDVYYRLEVFTQTGSQGYDLMGLSQQQVIDDVLDRFEGHLGFLRYSDEHDAVSTVTPPAAAAE